MQGGAIYGLPVVNIGFTPNFSWSHTVSYAHRFTPYALTLKPGEDGCITFEVVVGCATARAIGRPDDMVFSSDGRFAYVTTRDFMAVPGVGIIGLSIAADGTLSALPTSPYGGTDDYEDLAMTPDGRFLFAETGGDIDRFSVDANGSLTPLGLKDLNAGPRFFAVS